MNSKFGSLTRRRPEFGPGVAGAEAAKLKKFSDAGGSQIQWLSDAVKNQVLSSFVYNVSVFLSAQSRAKRAGRKTQGNRITPRNAAEDNAARRS